MVFDLEYGQPAASTTLPTSRPAFRDVLGCFGHAGVGKGLAESGIDLLYTSHQATLLILSHRLQLPAGPFTTARISALILCTAEACTLLLT